MKKVIEYLQPHALRMGIGFLIKFTGTIMDLLLPMILAYIIDYIVPTEKIIKIILWGFLMLFCSVAALLTNIIANRMAARVARDTTRKIRHDLFSKITYLSCKQSDDVGIPSLEARLTSDTYHLHQMVDRMQRLGVRSPILLVGGIFLTLSLDPILTLVLVIVLILVGFVVVFISRKGIPRYTILQKSVDHMVRMVRESASGVRIIKALSKTGHEKKHFDEVNHQVVQSETDAAVTMAPSNPLMNLFLNIGLIFVIIVGAYRVNSGITQTGTIIAFLSYFIIILNAMLSVNRMFILYSKGSASAGRINEILDMPEDLLLQDKDVVEDAYHVVFDHVSFSYNGNVNNLEDISFALEKGETLGIIGPTGCGKSTIINLLIRFYDADSGSIHINGRHVASIPFEELYQKFGIVFQNDVLLAETIAENIAFGRDLSLESINDAAIHAQAEPFIREIDENFSYKVSSRGTNLSGGQKQRVLIARALAAKPEILILDDSSSALDYLTDSLLRKTLRENYADTTTIIVAQRVSSIQHAKHILVLDDGKILGYGTHEKLLNSCEEYREIYHIQMNG